MLSRKDSHRCHHDRFNVGNGIAHLFCCLLRFLQQDYVLGDAIRLDAVLVHVGVEQDHVAGMKTPAVGIAEGHDLEGRPLCVEGVGVLEIVVPHLIDGVVEELGDAAFGCLIAGKVIKAGMVGSLCVDTEDGGGIVGDGAAIDGKAGGANKHCIAMVGHLPHSIHEDTCEQMIPHRRL
jgi:hypothetical protein